MGSLLEKIEWIEERLSPVSKAVNKFFSVRNHLGVCTCSSAFLAIMGLICQTLTSFSFHLLIIVAILFSCFLYMQLILYKIFFNMELEPNAPSNSRKFKHLYGVVKVVLQALVLKLIFVLGEIFESVKITPWLLIFTCAIYFIHLILLSRFFYIIEDYGLIDGLYSLTFSLLTHFYRRPWEQLIILLASSSASLFIHLRYSACCEDNRRAREEVEKKRVADEEEKQKFAEEKEETEKRRVVEEIERKKVAEEKKEEEKRRVAQEKEEEEKRRVAEEEQRVAQEKERKRVAEEAAAKKRNSPDQ